MRYAIIMIVEIVGINYHRIILAVIMMVTKMTSRSGQAGRQQIIVLHCKK
jgi:hypothetical protein